MASALQTRQPHHRHRHHHRRRHCRWQQVYLYLVVAFCSLLPIVQSTPLSRDHAASTSSASSSLISFPYDSDDTSNSTISLRVAVNVAAIAVLLFLSIAGAAIFYKLRDAPSIRHRQPFDTLLSTAAGTLLCVLILAREAFLSHYPCWIMLWAGYLLFPLGLWLISARSLMLAAIYFINKASAARIALQLQRRSSNARAAAIMVNDQRATDMAHDPAAMLSTRASRATMEADVPELQRLVRPDCPDTAAGCGSPLGHTFPRPSMLDEPCAASEGERSPKPRVEGDRPALSTRLVACSERYRDLATVRNRMMCVVGYLFVMFIFLGVIQLITIANAFDKYNGSNSNDCAAGWERYPLYGIMLFTPFVLLPAVLYFTRKTRDNFGIWWEGVASMLVTEVSFIVYFALVFSALKIPGHAAALVIVLQLVLVQMITVWWPAVNEWQKRGR
ncbi:hypothetical protein SYNPS1DRAFT_29583, partial [Syncephalis pseudoplumigaleata]